MAVRSAWGSWPPTNAEGAHPPSLGFAKRERGCGHSMDMRLLERGIMLSAVLASTPSQEYQDLEV